MTMLEKAARAAENAYHNPTDEPLWEQTARAVLIAVREPSETLSRAAQSTEGWEAMIDAILSEGAK
ncbi:hypothetical protein V8J38_11285 [Brevundimonas olei]|uniref:Uncharacterized protein n=1 Tax=Brevundimonas olei TaxID=657642 RepID=A0ABZ2I875_9CAUL